MKFEEIINTVVCGAMPGATKEWPGESINCSISSPPFWALRDYGVEGQLGLEPTFEEYIEHLCTIYDEVKRLLRKDGCCFVNLGDTYAQSAGKKKDEIELEKDKQRAIDKNYPTQAFAGYKGWQRGCNTAKGIPTKSLCLIPQRFAIEMVNRGWILRNVIIWHKPNPMPSSAKDRFTCDFEYVYFFVKSNQVLWHYRPADGKVSDKQPDFKNGIEGLDWQWGTRKGKKVKTSLWQGFKYWFEPQYEPLITAPHKPGWATDVPDRNDRQVDNEANQREWGNPLGRNKRCVWTIPTQPYSEAHFATFPEKLVEPMIKAGCPEFVCTKCGKAREKIYYTDYEFLRKSDIKQQPKQQARSDPFGFRGAVANAQHYFKGYTDCGCGADWRPGIVWDPFLRFWNDFTGSRQIAA